MIAPAKPTPPSNVETGPYNIAVGILLGLLTISFGIIIGFGMRLGWRLADCLF